MSSRSTLSSLVVMLLAMTIGSHKIQKRVVHGDPLFSHEIWNTQSVVLLVNSWNCISDQIDHEIGGCQDKPYCSGTILTVDFVITAGHCAFYEEFSPKFRAGIVQKKPTTPKPTFRLGIAREIYALYRYIALYVLKPRRLHEFYSNIAILGGSPEINHMNQKRHAERVFPHPEYKHHPDDPGVYDQRNHDIALVRVCVPFVLTKTLKPAPRLPMDKQTIHFDSLIQKSTACLFAGYGVTDDPNFRVLTFTRTKFLRYTWRFLTCTTVSTYCIPVRNPCVICTSGISPIYGSANVGDSGSPIFCDDYWTGITTGGESHGWINFSITYGYALHCIKTAITPQRLMHYESVKADAKLELMGPIQYGRQRLRV